MPEIRIAGLFSGSGHLETAAQQVFGGTIVWHSENQPAACTLLATRFPDTPNLGDITTINWATVEPIDILVGGFPCSDVSTAGLRAGLSAHTRSGLWAHMAVAVAALRPRIVVIENVKGLLSAAAHRTRTNGVEPTCVCSSIDRWRGIYRPGRQDERPAVELLRPGKGGDDGSGASSPPVDTSGVGRLSSAVTSGSRTTTAGLDMVNHRHECDSVPPSNQSLPADKGGTGSACLGSRADTGGSPPPWAEWYQSGMELARACRVRSDQEEIESPQREGSRRCEECGGFVPATTTDRNMEPGPTVMGDESAGHLRAIGAVLGDLADILYDTRGAIVSAASVGACHQRDRVFIVAFDTNAELPAFGNPLRTPGEPVSPLLPTPVTTDAKGARNSTRGDRGQHGGTTLTDAIRQGDLLPTPSVADGTGGHTSRSGDRKGEVLLGGIAKLLPEIPLLPSPFARDYKGAYPRADKGECLPGALEELRKEVKDNGQQALLPGAVRNPWGKYGPAIHRWEQVVGPAPSPTELSKFGNQRLNPAFSEWMLGWSRGWVTDLPISRTDKLKICGNGVVPQQCAAAVRQLLATIERSVDAVPKD